VKFDYERAVDEALSQPGIIAAAYTASGIEFVAYDAHKVEVQRENPFLSAQRCSE
jgi:hypothetical protein